MTTPAVGYRREDTRRRLESTGLNAPQAQALADIMTDGEHRLERMEGDIEVLKTDVGVLKTDVAELKVDVANLSGRMDGFMVALEGLRLEVRERIDALRKEMIAQLEAHEARLAKRIDSMNSGTNVQLAELKGETAGLKARIVAMQWLLGFLLALGLPAMLALVRLAFFPA